MTESVSLTSGHDRFVLSARRTGAKGDVRGGVVVIQEIFGLTAHIAEMSAYFAGAGYEALAPSLFDRIEPGFSAPLSAEGIAKGRAAVAATPWEQAAGDIQAAIDALPKPCFVVGFCWGGAAAWAAAARCSGLRAAACFYGRAIIDLLGAPPRIPVMLHYGARDESIPPAAIERVRAAAPADTPLYLYEAGHGFCRKASADYDADASALALKRTGDWFARWRASGEEA